MSLISKIDLIVAALDVVLAFNRIAKQNYPGAVLGFVLAGFLFWMAYEYRDLDL